MAAADGSGEVAVPMPWTEGGARWSHSGTPIAIPTQTEDGRVGTAILDAEGKVIRVLQIADPSLNLPCVIWSPDDARLACEGWDDTDDARRGIYTVQSADGGDIRRLTTPPAGMADLPGDWASDGAFVFKRNAGDEGDGPLYIVDGASGDASRLTGDGQEDPGRFSPDGMLVATSSNGVLEVFDRSGVRAAAIDRQPQYLFGPAWSPDGAWIAYSVSQGGPFAEVFISRPDGSDTYQVTRTYDNEIGVDWGRDPG